MQTATVTKSSTAGKNATILPAYIFAKVKNSKLDSIRDSLEDIAYVDWYGSITGRYDLALVLKGSEPKQVYSAIKSLREIDGIESTASFTPFEGFARKQTDDEDQESSMGQVFLRTQGNIEDILESLKKLPSVSEALVVAGEWDVVATVRGGSYEEILRTSIEEVGQIDGIRASETSFVYQPKRAE